MRLSAAVLDRTASLLRRFSLSGNATKAELKKAYLEKAKEYHPDVAGPGSEEAFRRIKDEYEEAMKLLREAEKYGYKRGPQTPYGGRPGASPYGAGPGADGYNWQGAEGFHWRQNQADGGQQARNDRYYEHQYQRSYWQQGAERHAYAGETAAAQSTPAQRLRNVALTSATVLGVTVLSYRFSTASQPAPPTRYAAPVRRKSSDASSSSASEVPVASASAPANAAPALEYAVGVEPGPAIAKAAVGSTAGGSSDMTTGSSSGSSTPAPGAAPKATKVEVSDYYRKRSMKNSLRVSGSDTYVSSVERPKSRSNDEGFGATSSHLATLASGARPSEAKTDAKPDGEAKTPTAAS
eukprot:gnl/TRDRNA2_/TRDRNA2_185547_c0_seq1.p1 gnl/TRDRNA2_/TRDRNA2_185547_c0~~gnl/TRDRNA2_/TRDRNA2_185547_c0_seq1.p1  ORF type:complete len:352 (-),score=65.03 gnl/TRDRNA2_/TRDRNA2_185547_c0_seq1:80-1135(-)